MASKADQARATADLLQSLGEAPVFAALATAIATEREACRHRRGRNPAWIDYAAAHGLANDQVAIAILAPLLEPWLDDEAPPVPTYIRKVAVRFRAPLGEFENLDTGKAPPRFDWEADRRAIGTRLLELALTVPGLLKIEAGWTGINKRDLSRVYPGSATLQHIAALQAHIAASHKPLTQPPAPEPRIRPNNKGLLSPPDPTGTDVANTLDLIQQSQWTVNPFMLDVLSQHPNMPRIIESDLQRLLGDYTAREHKAQTNLAAFMQAREWRGQSFYMAHSFDWRGRVYQQGGALQWTGGSDFARSLLQFHTSEPLNDAGEYWLGQYVAGLFGAGKTREARAEWIDDPANLAMLGRIVNDPWRHAKDWHRGNDKYRALAAAHAFVSRSNAIPLAYDCSSSVLQQWALMTRDIDLARKVGLCDEPGTFYDDVAAAVGRKATPAHVKRAAMTYWYNATVRGMSDALRKEYSDHGKRVPRTRCTAQAQWIIEACRTVAGPNAIRLRTWFQEAARAIPGPIEWTVPGGFRVLQDRRKQPAARLDIREGSRVRRYVVRYPADAIDRRAQADGLAPNVTHSLDAAVLMATVRAGARLGVRNWCLAHDCYGTNPNDGAALWEAPRAAARAVYADNVLQSIHDQFAAQATRGGLEAPPVMADTLPRGFTLKYMTA